MIFSLDLVRFQGMLNSIYRHVSYEIVPRKALNLGLIFAQE